MKDLPLEVRELDAVKIDDSELADSRRGQVQGHRRTEASRSDAKHAGVRDFFLALHSDFGQNEMPRVAAGLFVIQFHKFPQFFISCLMRNNFKAGLDRRQREAKALQPAL